MKYKEGDKVIIKDCDDIRDWFEKDDIIGKKCIITRVYNDFYILDDNKYCVNFTEDMIEKIITKKYEIGDKVRLLGTKEGRNSADWQEYFENEGRCKGDIVIINSVKVVLNEIRYFVKKEGVDCTNGYLLECDIELVETNIEEKQMKYEIGDKVKVRNDLIHKKHYGGILFVDSMRHLCGKIAIIDDIKLCSIYLRESSYGWSKEMFEGSSTVECKDGWIDGWIDEPSEKDLCSNDMREYVKMEPAKTKIEKMALEEAKKDAIAKAVASKKSVFEMGMSDFLSYEKNARNYRKMSDEKAKELNLSKEDINALF